MTESSSKENLPANLEEPMNALNVCHVSLAANLEYSFLLSCDFVKLSRPVRMNAAECKELEMTTTSLVQKFKVTANDVLDCVVPVIEEALENGDTDLAVMQLELASEWSKGMKTETEKTLERFSDVQTKVNGTMSTVKEVETTTKEKIETLTKVKAQNEIRKKELNDQKKKMEEEMASVRKELDNLETLWEEATSTAKEAARVDDLSATESLIGLIGEMLMPSAGNTRNAAALKAKDISKSASNFLSKIKGFFTGGKSKTELSEKKAEELHEKLGKARDRLVGLLATLNKTQENFDKVAKEQAQTEEDLAEHSRLHEKVPMELVATSLGKTLECLQWFQSFWDILANHCGSLVRRMQQSHSMLEKFKGDLTTGRKKAFKKMFSQGTEYWEHFRSISDVYVKKIGSSLSERYSFLEGAYDYNEEKRKRRVEELRALLERTPKLKAIEA